MITGKSTTDATRAVAPATTGATRTALVILATTAWLLGMSELLSTRFEVRLRFLLQRLLR